MPAARVVEAGDVIRCPAMVCLQTMRGEEGDFDPSAGLPVSVPDHFGLEGIEKALDGCPRHWARTNGTPGAIIAVAFSTHGRRQAVFSQDFLVIVCAVLATAIRVVNAVLWGPAQGNRHVQGTDRQIIFHPIADGPAVTQRECRSRMTAR